MIQDQLLFSFFSLYPFDQGLNRFYLGYRPILNPFTWAGFWEGWNWKSPIFYCIIIFRIFPNNWKSWEVFTHINIVSFREEIFRSCTFFNWTWSRDWYRSRYHCWIFSISGRDVDCGDWQVRLGRLGCTTCNTDCEYNKKHSSTKNPHFVHMNPPLVSK